MLITVKKFFEKAILPERAHWPDAGADVFVPEGRGVTVEGGETVAIPLGIGLELPAGYMACVYPRSGWTSRGIICQLPPIDSGYTGEIHAIVYNGTRAPVEIPEGAKIGQLVITPVILANFIFAAPGKHAGESREDSAFGSTGM